MNVSVFTIGRFHHFDLARQLRRLGHGMQLYTSNPPSRVDADLRPFAHTHSRYRIPFAIAGRLGFGGQFYWLDEVLLRDLARWMKRSLDLDWTDVLHALDGPGPIPGRYARANGKLWICDRGCTHIVAQKQILDAECKDWGLPPIQFAPDRLERCVEEYEESHAITVPSQFARRSFLAQGIADKRIFVCPYGVNLAEFRPAPKRDAKFRVIHVGQINIRKGIGHLLRAVEPLARAGQIELWLVGQIDPAVRGILHQYKSLFEFKGVVPRKDLWQFYTQASVLVLASVEEGLSLVQAQAMACGVPVISTENTGAEDLFSDGVEGFIVPARNPEAIRDRIQWMMDNPQRRDQMAAAALERVKLMGGWDRYGECVERVYEQVAARHDIRLRNKRF